MRLRIDVLLGAFLCWGCARAGHELHAPHIAVNQAGLSERLRLVAQEAEVDETEVDEAEAEPVRTDSEHRGREYPEKPDPETSSRRVAFRRSGETARDLESTTREPDSALGPGRDPRSSRFLAREQERLRRAGEQ